MGRSNREAVRVSWFNYLNSLGVIAGLAAGAYQIRRLAKEGAQRDADRRTERSLELYRDLVVDGDTANAFHRLSVLLRHKGTSTFGKTTWYVMEEADFGSGGLLDASLVGIDTPFQDFYRVIWFFERAYNALYFGLVNPNVLFQTTGFHCWWWGQLFRKIESPKAMYALQELIPQACDWARKNGEYERWVSHCMTDFDGHGPVEPLDEQSSKGRPHQQRSPVNRPEIDASN